MKPSSFKVNQKVRITKTGSMAAEGEEGFISELRGYDFEAGKPIARFLMVWITKTAAGKPTRRVISITSLLVEVIKEAK